MKTKLILLAGTVAVLSSCSTAYRIGQTPDDVYYSPVPEKSEYVSSYTQQDKNSYGYNNSDRNTNDVASVPYSGDLSMGYGYNSYNSYGSAFYSPYSSFYYNPYSYYSPYSSFFSPYSTYPLVSFYPYSGGYGGLYNYGGGLFNGFYSPYNSFYSPYYSNYYYPSVYYPSKPGNTVGNTIQPRRFNLRSYNVNTPRTSNTGGNINVPPAPVRGFGSSRVNTNNSNNTTSGNSTRRAVRQTDNNYNNRNNRSFDNRDNNYNNSQQTQTRTFQPAPQPSTPSPSPSSSGSSGGSAPVRTFRR